VLTGVSDDQLLKALGQCALVFLDCVRGQIRKDILEEAETLPMNGVEGVLSTWNEVGALAFRFNINAQFP